MSQDTTILPTTGTVSGLEMTQAANAALATLLSLYSGSSAPTSPVAYQWWVDTSTTVKTLKIRNAANNAWVILGFLNGNYIHGLASGPDSFLMNGLFVPSVASNNLTVGIYADNGAAPSTNGPVFIKFGGIESFKSVTSALSLTLNAGTNWFNSGSAELAGQEVDYFVYLIYTLTTPILGISRIPNGRIFSDFSGTSTNEKYMAVTSAPDAAAPVALIGRFNMKLGASATYYWAEPTAYAIIYRPIYETRSLIWTPTLAGFTGTPTVTATYQIRGGLVYYTLHISGTSNGTTFTATLPLSALRYLNNACKRTDDGTNNLGNARTTAGSATLTMDSDMAGGAWTNSGTKELRYFQSQFEF